MGEGIERTNTKSLQQFQTHQSSVSKSSKHQIVPTYCRQNKISKFSDSF